MREGGPDKILQSSSWSPEGSVHFASENEMAWKWCPMVAGTMQQQSCPKNRAERKSPNTRARPTSWSQFLSHSWPLLLLGSCQGLPKLCALVLPTRCHTVHSFVKGGFCSKLTAGTNLSICGPVHTWQEPQKCMPGMRIPTETDIRATEAERPTNRDTVLNGVYIATLWESQL